MGTAGLVGRHILPVKHICFSEQVFRGMLEESGEVRTSLTKLIKQEVFFTVNVMSALSVMSPCRTTVDGCHSA